MSSVNRSDDNSGGSDRKPSTTQVASAALSASSRPLIILHASGWRTKADVYAALLPALGAPAWHGHNLDALNDSLTSDMINAVQPPLTLRFVGLSQSTDEVRSMIDVVEEIAADAREQGFSYEIQRVEAEPAISSD